MKTRRIFKKVLLLFLSVVLIGASVSGCGKQEQIDNKGFESYQDFSPPTTEVLSGTVCENDKYKLLWDNDSKQVSFFDKSNQAVYSSLPEEAKIPQYDEDGMLIANSPIIESPIIVYYYDQTKLKETEMNAADSIANGTVYSENIDNGIKVYYEFEETQIVVPVEYIIKDECFTITVDTENISDNDETFITGVSVAPFMCGVKNDSPESYLFIPDGCGALFSVESINMIGKQKSVKIYGEDICVSQLSLSADTEDIKMPVFGMKNKNNAICGIITSGEEQASLNWNIGSVNIGYSAVYPFFRIRGYNDVNRPPRFLYVANEVQVFGDYVSTEPFSISYYPLSDYEANYSGMARVYREYLKKSGILQRNNFETVSANLKIFGGIMQKVTKLGISRDVLKELTTLEDTDEMLTYFSENTDADLLVDLVGFGISGLDYSEIAGGFDIASKLGSNAQIVDLQNKWSAISIKTFMDFDVISFAKSGSGFKVGTDSAVLPNGQVQYLKYFDQVTQKKKTDKRYSLLKRSLLEIAVQKVCDYSKEIELSGISLASLSNTIYSDYSNLDSAVVGNMSKQVSDIILKVKENHEFLGRNSNDYAAGCSDYIIDTPIKSSNYEACIAEVPFYQMVFRGYAGLSSTALNLSTDSRIAFLRCVESGISPTWSLTKNYDTDMGTSDYSALCSSDYFGNRDDIVCGINEIAPIIDKIGDSEITDHIISENGLKITKFSNGITVVVNETDSDKVYDNYNVAKMDYIVLEGK